MTASQDTFPDSNPENIYSNSSRFNRGSTDVQLLVYSYLIQCNYPKTATLFAGSCGLDSELLVNHDHTPTYLLPNKSSSFFNSVSNCIFTTATTAQPKDNTQIRKEDSDSPLNVSNNKITENKISIQNSDSDSNILILDPNAYQIPSLYTPKPFWNPGIVDYQSKLLVIRDSIMEGSIDLSIELLSKYFPDIIDSGSNSYYFRGTEENVIQSTFPPYSTASVLINELPIATSRNYFPVLARYKLDSQKFAELLISNNDISAALKFSRSILQYYPILFNIWSENSYFIEKHEVLSADIITQKKRTFNLTVASSNSPKSCNTSNSSQFDKNSKTIPPTGSEAQKSDRVDIETQDIIADCDLYPGSDKLDIISNILSKRPMLTNYTPPKVPISHTNLKLATREISSHFRKLCSLGAVPNIDSNEIIATKNPLARAELADFIDTFIMTQLGYPHTPALVAIMRQLLAIFNIIYDNEAKSLLSKDSRMSIEKMFDLLNSC
ncbi:hypothetical protein AYI69_g813 [Smittium culicis]|uniref:Uncharacterized protein n=1 Tax=Smittium culicis TaxID=133412 RepID=A0A1R1YRZ8_9FUNG|nr:hypothetical protein AYI69_g813 [Smittium culicis]